MNVFEIFKRSKPIQRMPEPDFTDNWLQDEYLKSIKRGLDALQKGTPVLIHDDGRGFEKALEIKQRFILEYTKQLSEKIKIKSQGVGGREILISIEP